MPYKVYQRGKKWVVINTDTKDVKGTHDSREKAMRQFRLLWGVESGSWHPTGAKAKK